MPEGCFSTGPSPEGTSTEICKSNSCDKDGFPFLRFWYCVILYLHQLRIAGFSHRSLLTFSQVSSLRNEKRGSSYLISAPEGGSVELAGQHPQDTGVSYTETYLKKKRVY